MTSWPLPDPSPDEDMDSDITFGAWLGTLTTARVILDFENSITPWERSMLLYLRKVKRRENGA